MRFANIHIENFRCFQNIDIDLQVNQENQGGLTVLVAQNAEGKTTVLDAINIVLGPFLSELTKTEDEYTIKYYDNHRLPDFSRPPEYAKIDATLLNPPGFVEKEKHENFHVIRYFEGLYDSTGTKGITKTDDRFHMSNLAKYIFKWNNDGKPWPLIAYYGDQRLWESLSSSEYNNEPMLAQDRLAGYLDARKPAIGYKRCLLWMRELSLALFGEKQKKEEGDPSYNMEIIEKLQCYMDCMKSALREIMEPSGYTEFNYNISKNEIEVWGKNHPVRIEASRLSAGIRIVMGMVSDMVYRCCLLNPQLKGRLLQDTPGIVLIDEIELHLHPAWQQTILPSLQKIFPNIQFIVTTHSPQVVSSVPKECVRVIDNGEILHFSTPIQGVEVGDILSGIFGTDRIPKNSEIARKLDQLHVMLAEGKGNSPEWNSLYQELEKYYGVNYPPLQGAIEHRDFLNEMHEVR